MRTEPHLRLIIEDDFVPADHRSKMVTKDIIYPILKMDELALSILPKDIDPLPLHDDTIFFDMLKENQNILAYLIN